MKKLFKAITRTVVPMLAATPALAHNGEHELSHWFEHMLTSSDHLIALLGLTLAVGVVATGWHLSRNARLKKRRTEQGN